MDRILPGWEENHFASLFSGRDSDDYRSPGS